MYTHRHFGERDRTAPVTGAPPMTRDPARGQGARPSERGLPIEAGLLLLAIIVSGLLLRAFIAGIWLPRSGFGTDIGDFTAWAVRLARVGPSAFYVPGLFSDYPPGYLYVLWGLGSIGHALQPFVGLDVTSGLVKIPAILADAGVAWLLFLTSRRFLGGWVGDTAGEWIGIVAATVYLFNPGVIFDSSVWGQVDSVGMLAVLASVYLLARGWTEAAAATAVLAMLLKFQFGFMIPIVLLIGLKRHLFGRSTDPDQDGRPDVLRILTSLAAGLGTLVILIFPFGLSVWSPGSSSASLFGKFLEAANTYKGLSINAFNVWMNPWSALAAAREPGGLTPSLFWGDDQTVVAVVGSLSVTWQLVGITLFLGVAAAAAYALWRRDDATGILVATLLVAVAFFVVPTRVHERYLFPALVLGAPLVVRGARWAIAYVVLSVAFFANIYGVYTADWSFSPGGVMNPGTGGAAMVRDPLLRSTLLSEWGIYLVAAVSVVLLGWLLIATVGVAREVDARRRPAWDDLDEDYAGAAPEVRTDAAAAPAESSVVAGLRMPHWLRVDRSHPLFGDPPRRLDRVDLVLVLVLLLVAFGYRLWRLDTPRSMHFDEVYHARSAMEFLADWEHGWTRDVYEWTHPMVAKYLIAAGMEITDPNKVVASTSLERSSPALAVAERRTAIDEPRSVAFTADGSTVVALDALTGQRVASWDAGGPIASLAYDDTSQRLLVGGASGGQVRIYRLGTFLAVTGPRAPPAQTGTINTGLASVEQIVVDSSLSTIAFRGSNGITTAERETGAVLATKPIVTPALAIAPGSDDPAVIVVDTAKRSVMALDPSTLAERSTGVTVLDEQPLGPLAVVGTGTDQQVWIAVGDLPKTDEHPAVNGGITVLTASSLAPISTVPLPGRATALAWQSIANIVYATGSDPSGTAKLWEIDALGDSRSGFATFDETALPAPATAMAFDISNHAQADDDARLLVATRGSNGATLVNVDAGSNAFAWRLMGIVFGAVLVVLIYLLAAAMFRRRGIAILAALFVTFDGMSYVMSRIAMNDIYVAVFIVAAYLVFWQIWSSRWARSAWWALPLVGVLIGLAAATKWVGWYALAGLWVLVLARSALGRFLLVGAIGFLTIVAGIGAPWPFVVVCAAALIVALLLAYVRPVRLQAGDLMALPASGVVLGAIGVAFAIGYGQVAGRNPKGAVEVLFDFLARGTQAAWPAFVMLGVAGVLLLVRAAVSLRSPESDRRWMRPGELAGFAWPWVGACLLVIPLLVYFLAYIPYLQLGHSVSIPGGPGYGWSLDELQVQMFAYHFGLQAGHPAASPWWSWPLDLKPVWFYGSPGDWDSRLVAAIYNGGNPILFWAGVPAILGCALLAWRRLSPALVLLVAAFAFQYLPWTRVERATFQYHYFTAVLFAMIALAYLVDEALRSRAYQALAVAFLVAAVIVGVLVWPLGAAWPMPDFYMNAARALPPWNYNFQFPNPPQGPRGDLVSANAVALAAGTVLGLASAAFAMWGREIVDRMVLLFGPPIPADEDQAAMSRTWLRGSGSHGSEEEDEPKQDDEQRPQLRQSQPPEVVPRQEPGADEDQDRSDHDSASP
jgi:predicted membrane-bound dolichyl-phosphate-mannose-protein mannosyltransferase